MTAAIATSRGRAGSALVLVGAFLLFLGTVMFVTTVPATVAFGHEGFPHGPQNCDASPLADERATGGWKIEIGSDETPPSTGDVEATGVAAGDVIWSITLDPEPGAAHTSVYTSSDWTGYWFNYNYTGSGFTLYGIRVKVGESNSDEDGAFLTSINPGSIQIPNGTSHITLCFDTATGGTTTTTVADTTTTTVADTTTTTVADTTTTTVADTTTTTVPATTTTTVADTTTTTVAATTTTTVADTTTTTVAATTTTTVADTTTTTVADTTTTTVPATTTTTVADTTTTTAGDSTTTTVGGPEEPTTTTTSGGTTTTTVGDTTTTTGGGTTTTVAGPDDPELPDNGPGQLLAVLLAGLGLMFMGSGSLVIASERRKYLGA